MENVRLGEIESYRLNKKIILVLDEGWLKYFETEPIFQVVLNKNRIMLLGPKIAQNPTTDEPTSTKMEILH